MASLGTAQVAAVDESKPAWNSENHTPELAQEELTPEPNYPEGGRQAWLVVWGSWCGLVAGLGTVNTIASFQTYVLENQLKDYSASEVGWIFSVYTFVLFACGLVIGPVFDKHGPRWLIIPGSVLICGSMIILGSCQKYVHFMLDFAIMGGLGSSLLFTPCIAVIGHYFHKKRAYATGLAATGGAIGGIAFPLMLKYLIPQIGFAWTCRTIGFIYIALCINGIIFIRSRLPPLPNATAYPDFRIFRDITFSLTVAGVFLIEWALFIPLTYISSYAIAQGFSTDVSYNILIFLNVGSFFGRSLPGFYADRIGRFNATIILLILTIILIFGVLLPVGHIEAALIVFALLFGFASGSNISLTPVCVGQLCATEEYGRYYATCYTIVSLGCLTGIPIAGKILEADGGNYWGLIVFTGMCYAGALGTFVVARVLKKGWGWRVIY